MAVPVEQGTPGALPWLVSSGSQPLVVRQNRKIVMAAVTRPANTTAYAISDAVGDGTVITFPGCGRVNGGSGLIKSISMIDSANQTTNGLYNFYLFDTIFTPDADNAPFTPTDAEMATLIGVWEMRGATPGDATVGAGGNLIYQGQREGGDSAGAAIVIPNEPVFVCGPNSTSLFGALVARNTYTPVSAEVFTFRLHVEQD
jgi:hypothetical protein